MKSGELTAAEPMRRFLLLAASDLQPSGRLERMVPHHLAGLAWVLAKSFTPELSQSEALEVPEAVVLAVRWAVRKVARRPEHFSRKATI